MKSRLIMIRYIVRHPPFYPWIFSGVSPSVGSAGHLPGSHLSGHPLGGPPVRPAGGHLTSSVHRCPEGHAVMNGPVAGGRPGWARRTLSPTRGKSGLERTVLGKLGSVRPVILLLASWLVRMMIIHLILTKWCCNMKNSDISLGKASWFCLDRFFFLRIFFDF